MNLESAEKLRIQNLFHQLGFTPKDLEIYLDLLKNGASSIQEITTRIRSNRMSVHNQTSTMLKNGLIFETRKGKRRLLHAEEPEIFQQLLDRKLNELKSMEGGINHAVQFMTALSKKDASKPAVRFYQGVQGLKKMLEESLSANRDKKVYVFIHVHIFSKLLDPDYLENYFLRRAEKGIRTQLIFPPCDFAHRVYEKSAQYKIDIRLVPENWTWQAGLFVWDSTVALMSFTEGKITCTLLENEDLSDFFKKIIFPMCWEQAQKF